MSDTRLLDAGVAPQRFARGWHCLGLTRDFQDGKPHAIRAFDGKLVVWADSKGALHVHGGVLKDRYEEVPQDRPVVVVCGSGYRGSIAASFLKSHGYEGVGNVLGGMSAWKAAGLPIVR